MQVVDCYYINLCVYECGVVEILVCGIGVCVVVVVGICCGLLDLLVVVQMYGGVFNIVWVGLGELVMMIGFVVMVFEGEIELFDLF